MSAPSALRLRRKAAKARKQKSREAAWRKQAERAASSPPPSLAATSPACAVPDGEAGRDEIVTLRATLNHPFYVQGRGWTPVADLKPGDRLRTPDHREATVEQVTRTGEDVPVFNIEVPGQHTYFVAPPAGGPAVLVHNETWYWPREKDASRDSWFTDRY